MHDIYVITNMWRYQERRVPALFWNASDFMILHQNVCGLATKIDILDDFILKKIIKIFWCDRNSLPKRYTNISCRYQGVHIWKKWLQQQWRWSRSIYIKKNIEYICRNDLNDEIVETVCIEILQNNSKSFILGLLYRPPVNFKHLSKIFESSSMKIIDQVNSGNRCP